MGVGPGSGSIGRGGGGDASPARPITSSASEVLQDPSPAQARRAAAALAASVSLGAEATSGLLLAVSEIVTNAHLHGRPPVVVALRADGAPAATATHSAAHVPSVTVTVRDAGPGPAAVPADVLPPPDAVEGGRGCWLARRSVADYRTAVDGDGDGYEVCLVARDDRA